MSDTDLHSDQAAAHQAVVETLWTAPIVESCRKRLPTTNSDTTVLVAESRCGYVPLQLVPRVDPQTRIIALDGDGQMLDVARKRVEGDGADDRIYFVAQSVDDLSYADGVFRAGICLNGLVTATQARRAIAELVRVSAAGAPVVAAAPLASSFPEFYDLLDEALRAHQLGDAVGERFDQLRAEFVRPDVLAGAARRAGLVDLEIDRLRWQLSFEGGRDFLQSPLIRQTFFGHWLGLVRSADREPVLRYVGDAIDTYWHPDPFETTIEAAVMVGHVPDGAHRP